MHRETSTFSLRTANHRRGLAAAGLCVLALLTAVGCGGGKQVAGTWTLDRTATAKYFPTSKLLSGQMATISFKIVFKESGSVTFDVNGIQRSGTWKHQFGSYVIQLGGEKYALRMKGDLLIDKTKNKSQGACFRRAGPTPAAPAAEGPVGAAPPKATSKKLAGGNNPNPFAGGSKRPRPNTQNRSPSITTNRTPPNRARSRTITTGNEKMSGEKLRLKLAGVNAMDVSHDGQFVLACTGSEAVLVEIAKGENGIGKKTTLPARCDGIQFASDGEHAIAWNSSGGIFFFNATESTLLKTINYGTRVAVAAISHDGKTIAAGGSSSGSVALYSTDSGSQIGRYTKQKGDVLALEFTADNQQLWVGDTGGYVLVNAKDGRETSPRVDYLAGSRVRTIAVSLPQQRALISNAVWDLTNGAEIGKFADSEPFSAKSDFSSGPFAAFCSGFAREVMVIDHRSSKTVAKLGRHPASIAAVALSPDGKSLYSATREFVHVFGLPSPESNPVVNTAPQSAPSVDNGRVRQIRKMQSARFYHARSLAMSADGTFALVGSSSNPTYYFDVASGRRLGARPFAGQTDVVSIDISADGEIAITGDRTGGVYMWNTTNGRMIKQLTGHTQGEVFVSISPDGSQAITASAREEDELIAWNVEGKDPKVIKHLKGHVKDIIAVKSLDEGRAASISSHTIALWRTGTGKAGSIINVVPRRGSFGKYAQKADFTADGQFVLVGTREGFALWDAFKKKAVSGVDNRSFRADALALAPDGRFGVVYNGGDRTITVYDFKLRNVIDNFKPEDAPTTIDISLDGTQFMTASYSGGIILYQMPKLAALPSENGETNKGQ